MRYKFVPHYTFGSIGIIYMVAKNCNLQSWPKVFGHVYVNVTTSYGKSEQSSLVVARWTGNV